MPKHIAEARMSSRGQIALPKKVKEMLKIEEGDYVLFFTENKQIYIETGKLSPKVRTTEENKE